MNSGCPSCETPYSGGHWPPSCFARMGLQSRIFESAARVGLRHVEAQWFQEGIETQSRESRGDCTGNHTLRHRFQRLMRCSDAVIGDRSTECTASFPSDHRYVKDSRNRTAMAPTILCKRWEIDSEVLREERAVVEHELNSGPRPTFVHVHVCLHCGYARSREEVQDRELNSGILQCANCGMDGPLNIEIRDSPKTLT